MTKRRDRSKAVKPAKSSTMSPMGRGALELARTIVPVVAVFLVTRVAVAAPYYIPSGSMEPTLLVGDRVFVNNLRYGPHIPLVDLTLPGYADPQRGDIAVFRSPPQHPSIRIAPDIVSPTLVKRIVGIPGDTLAMRSGELFVNGSREVGFMPTVTAADMLSHPLFQWQRQFEVSTDYLGAPPASPTLHHWGPLVVPQDMYFMLGDNRDSSIDSRFYGLVPRQNLRGRMGFVYHSYDPAGTLPIPAITAVRWNRIGDVPR